MQASKKSSIQKGLEGESLACEYLVSHGYQIVKRNFRCPRGEIDIIAIDTSGCLVFFEVKTDLSRSAGNAAAWVHTKKVVHIQRAAEVYLSTQTKIPTEMRFDVITLTKSDELWEINHIANAFIPNGNMYCTG